jgi:hypothetical protein
MTGNVRACESLLKRAVEAASARGASVGSTLYLQISDIDSEVGECDPLTLLKRFKVGRQIISHFFVNLCCITQHGGVTFRRRLMAMFFTTMSKNSRIVLQRASRRFAARSVQLLVHMTEFAVTIQINRTSFDFLVGPQSQHWTYAVLGQSRHGQDDGG